MDMRVNNVRMSDNPLNTKRVDYLAKQRIDEEFNYLYDDTAKDFSGYDQEECVEYDSQSCYE